MRFVRSGALLAGMLALLVGGKVAAQTMPCGDGREKSPDTSGHCCWPGQAWNGARCVGAPSACPAGFQNDTANQTCNLLACPAGKHRAADRIHCCWPAQGYSAARNACVGVAKCPKGTEPEGDECVDVDKDHDGIPNKLDKCPDEPEDFNGFEDTDGCPDEAKRQALIAAEKERKERAIAVNAIHPLSTLGGARYVGGFGLVLPSATPAARVPESDAVARPIALPVAESPSRTNVQWGPNIGWVHWGGPSNPNSPVGAGPVGQRPFYDMDALSLGFWVRPDFRAVGRVVTVWFDVRMNVELAVGHATVMNHGMSVTTVGGSSHVGIDLQPWSFFGVGPFVGFRVTDYILTGDSSGNTRPSWSAVDTGGDLGLHARLRTLDRPKKRERLYLDAELLIRQGPVMSGIYQRDELAVRADGGFTFFVAADVRLGTAGSPQPSDFQGFTFADILAKTAPMQSTLSTGISF